MKRFLRKFALFLIFTISLNVLLLLVVVSLNRFAVDNCELADGVTSVIIGDSHTNWSIDATEIAGVENISFNAEGYVYTFHKLKHLLSKEDNVSHVYLGFGYHNLSDYYDEYIFGSLSKNFVHRYIGVMPIGDLFKVILKNPGEFGDIFRRILQKGGESGLKQQCSLYGTFPAERKMESYNPSQMEKRILAQYFNADGTLRGVSENNLEYLDKIIALLRKNNVDITLLNTPLHTGYVNAIPEEFKSLYHGYLDLNQLNAYEFEDLALSDAEFLPDGDHVNYDGAILTTERFKFYHENFLE